MGAIGLSLWLSIAAFMARDTWRAFKGSDIVLIGYWSATWVLWLSSCAGVVLEGPMGAVFFWSLLGLAHSRQDTLSTTAESGESKEAQLKA